MPVRPRSKYGGDAHSSNVSLPPLNRYTGSDRRYELFRLNKDYTLTRNRADPQPSGLSIEKTRPSLTVTFRQVQLLRSCEVTPSSIRGASWTAPCPYAKRVGYTLGGVKLASGLLARTIVGEASWSYINHSFTCFIFSVSDSSGCRIYRHLSELNPMFAKSEAGQRIAASLAHRVNGSAEGFQVAEAITSMFEDINIALTPIIGPKGVAALHRRSLQLCVTKHLPLGDSYKMLVEDMDLKKLKALLAEHSTADALFFGEEVLKIFYELLATLIGQSLAARLLLDVWEQSFSGPPAQEISR